MAPPEACPSESAGGELGVNAAMMSAAPPSLPHAPSAHPPPRALARPVGGQFASRRPAPTILCSTTPFFETSASITCSEGKAAISSRRRFRVLQRETTKTGP